MSDTEISLKKKMKSIASNFHRIFECPVCFDILKYPFKWCTNGHGICTDCTKALEVCPTCKATFTSDNTTLPLCLKNVLEALPRFCCYSDAGCEEIVEQGDDHEKFCGFRPFLCIRPNCGAAVPLCNLMSHFEESHEDYVKQIIIDKTKAGFTFMFSFTSATRYYILIWFLNNWLWVVYQNNIDEQCLQFTCYSTPMGKPVDNYFVRVQFEEEKFVYSNVLRAYEISSCAMKSLEDWHSLSNNDHSKDLFFKLAIPFGLFKYFLDETQSFQIKFEFFTMPKEN